MSTAAFEALGLPYTAGPAEVKARWRKLLLMRHPDHGGTPEQLEELNRAYLKAYETALLTPCPECHGAGVSLVYGGFLTSTLPCVECHGSGRRY